METQSSSSNSFENGISLSKALVFASLGVLAFHVSYAIPSLSFLVLFYPAGIACMSLAPTRRKAFYPVLLIGLAVYAPHLMFFWDIFGPPALVLWLVLALWLALFSVSAWVVRTRLGFKCWLLVLPILWTGFEYFRSELYYLRFSWLNIGYVFSDSPQIQMLLGVGMYGVGFVCVTLVAFVLGQRGKAQLVSTVAVVTLLAVITNFPAGGSSRRTGTSLQVAGVQSEFPLQSEVPRLLDKVLVDFPDAELFVMSEYTLTGTVPETVREWCVTHGKYLIIGGKEPASKSEYYNTAFVVGPSGEIVFQQAKSVPIQFFKDGLPAPEQKIWDSPWGKLAIPTCYDLSYTRVLDRFVEQGAQGIINPTMDTEQWGEYEHRLHARVPKVRAVEYRVPVFRVASSGISQLVDASGRAIATAPFLGEEATLGGEMLLAASGRFPADRWIGPICVGCLPVIMLAALTRTRRIGTLKTLEAK